MSRTEAGDLALLGFLDLDDHFSRLEDRRRIGADGRAGLGIGPVLVAGARAGAGFDEDLVAVRDQRAHAIGQNGHPVFVSLDFLRQTDPHETALLDGWW